MTLDWQVLMVASVAISLRLVAISNGSDLARAEDEQFLGTPNGSFCPPHDQAAIQTPRLSERGSTLHSTLTLDNWMKLHVQEDRRRL
jgi:hypothetical protein